ncbi:MAG: ArnT family glycosyltransferase [Candidatus Binataceae bacterium]
MDYQAAPEASAEDAPARDEQQLATVASAFDKTRDVIDHSSSDWLVTLASPLFASAIIAVTGILIFIVNLGGYPLYTKGEPREAVTVYDILHGGGVILPMRAGVEIPSKPLMMHWLAAIVSVLAGTVNAWTVRLPSGVLAIGAMLLCYFYVRRLFEARAALFSALILGTTFQFMQAGTGARVDMTLTFFMEVAFFEFLMIAEELSTRTILMYVAIACAVLSKGPIGLALPVLVALLWIALWRRWTVISRLHLWRGVIIVGGLAGGWYLAASLVGGMAFVHKQILSENLYRLFGHQHFREGHAHPFYYMELALMAGFLPWTPVALLAAAQYFHRPRKLDPRLGYMLLWFLAVLVFYNFPHSKRGVYLLALYPALATLVALALSDASRERAAIARWVNHLSRAGGIFLVAAGTLGLLGLALLFFYPAPIRWILSLFNIVISGLVPELAATAKDVFSLSIAIPIGTAIIGYFLLRTRPSVEKMTLALTGGMVCLALAVNLVVGPALADTLTLRSFAADSMKMVGSDSVGYLGALDYDFAFYSRRDIPIISLTKDPTDYVLCWKHDYKLIGPQWRRRLRIALTSNPTALDGSGRMLLLKRIDVPPTASVIAPSRGHGEPVPSAAKPAQPPPIYSL